MALSTVSKIAKFKVAKYMYEFVPKIVNYIPTIKTCCMIGMEKQQPTCKNSLSVEWIDKKTKKTLCQFTYTFINFYTYSVMFKKQTFRHCLTAIKNKVLWFLLL